MESFDTMNVVSIVLILVIFLFFAFFGVPYTHSDIAQKGPSLEYTFLLFGILATVGILFVYIFNVSVHSYILGCAILLIATTIHGRMSQGGKGGPGVPGFLREMGILGGVSIPAYFSYRFAAELETENPTLQTLARIYVGVMPLAFGGYLLYAIQAILRGMLEYRMQKKPCGIQQGVAPFEGFQSATLEARMLTAIDRVQNDLEKLVDQADSTCSIIQEVEQGYVGARSGPEDEAEYSLPQEEQQRRRQTRQERALKAFATNRKIYAATRNTQLLECFQNPTEEEVTLRELCAQLHSLLENAETLAQIKKMERMQVDLDYAERMIQKSEGFQNAPTPTPTPTQIYSTLRGAALQEAAEALLAKELNLHNEIEQIQQKINRVRLKLGKAYTKANMVATGKYD